MTDMEIMESLESRQSLGLRQLEALYGSYCLAIAKKILGDEQEAQQVVNDTWMQVWCAIPPARPENLRLYVGRTVRNLALNHLTYLRAQKRSWGLQLQLDELAQVIPARYSALDPEQQHLKDALNRFLEGLPKEYRQIFLRRYWYSDTTEELAQRFHCTPSRVSGILFRLRKQLKKLLEKEDLAP